MPIVITLEIDDKGSAKIKKFGDEADKSLNKATKSGSVLNKELGPGFNKVGDFAFKASTAIAKFALELGAVGLTAFVAGLTLVVKEASSLEQKMDFLGAVLKDKTEASFTDLNNVVLELGATTEWMSTQVAQAGEALAKAGFSTQEIIGALPGTLSLATAGTLDLSQAATITSSTLRAFGIQAEETTKVADILAKTAITTNTTIQSIGDAMTYVAPLARTAGISLQETSAAIGLLGNVGIQASMAGTTLRAAIASLLSPTKEQSELMKELGLNVTTGKGGIVSLTEVIKQLKESGATTGEILELFGRRGGPGMAALLSMGSEALAGMTTELENAGGTAENVAEEKLDNFRGQMIILKSATQNFMIALGDPLLPQFSNFIKEQVIPIVQNMSEYVKNNKDEIANFGTGLIEFFTMVGSAMQSIGSVMLDLMPIMSSFFEFMGYSLAFVGQMINVFVNKIVNSINRVIEISAFISSLIPGLDGVAESLRQNKIDASSFTEGIDNAGESMIQMGWKVGELTDSLTKMSNGIFISATSSNKMKEEVDDLNESTSTLYNTVEGQIIPSLFDVQEEFYNTEEQAGNLNESIYGLTDNTLYNVDEMNSSLGTLSQSWDNVGSSIGGASDSLNDFSLRQREQDLNIQRQQTAGEYTVQMTPRQLNDYFRALSHVSPHFSHVAFQEGGIVPGKPNQEIPAILHGGEMVTPYDELQKNNGPIVVQFTIDQEVLAEGIININNNNISGFGEKFNPTKRNLVSFRDAGY